MVAASSSVSIPSGQEMVVTSSYWPVEAGSAIALNSKARGSLILGSRFSPNWPVAPASSQSPEEPASKRPR